MKIKTQLGHSDLTPREQNLFAFLDYCAKAHGVTLRAAGGWVRDKLLGIPSHDIDIAVQGMSGAEFAQKVANKLGRKITVIEARPEQSKHLETAMLEVHGFPVDFAGLRTEEYGESRIPTIKEGTPEQDAQRRDLSINGLFYNIHTHEIEDYVGGIQDLKLKQCRTPLNPVKTFSDDPLRILRCIRFASKYEFDVDEETERAMSDPKVQEDFISKISKERIWAEMFGVQEAEGFKTGFLTGHHPDLACILLKRAKLIDVLFSPKDVKLNPWDTEQNNPHHNLNIIDHTLHAVLMGHLNKSASYLGFLCELAPVDKGVITLALVLHDLGKRDPGCIQEKDDGTYSYLGHDDRSVELSDIVLDQLGAPKGIKNRVLRLVKEHMRYHVLEKKPTGKALRRIVRDMEEDWRLLVMHSKADAMGKMGLDYGEVAKRYDDLQRMTEEAIESMGSQVKVQRPINGHELMNAGIPKGKVLGDIFAALDEELLGNPEMSSEAALEFCLEFYGRISDGNRV